MAQLRDSTCDVQHTLRLSEAGMPASLAECATVLAGLADEGRCLLAEAFAGYIFRAAPGTIPQAPLVAADAHSMGDVELELVAALRAAAVVAPRGAALSMPWPPPAARCPMASAASGVRGSSDSAPSAGAFGPRPRSGASVRGGCGVDVASEWSGRDSASDGGLGRARAPWVTQTRPSASMDGSGASSTSGHSMHTALAACSGLPAAGPSSFAPAALMEQLARVHVSNGGSSSHAVVPFVQTQLPYAAAAPPVPRQLTAWASKAPWQTQDTVGEQMCCKELARAYVLAGRSERARRLLNSLLRCAPLFATLTCGRPCTMASAARLRRGAVLHVATRLIDEHVRVPPLRSHTVEALST